MGKLCVMVKGDILICVKGYNDSFTKGDKYIVHGISDKKFLVHDNAQIRYVFDQENEYLNLLNDFRDDKINDVLNEVSKEI